MKKDSTINTPFQNNINPIIKMIEDSKTIAKAIKEGKDLSKLEGIKIVSPLSIK